MTSIEPPDDGDGDRGNRKRKLSAADPSDETARRSKRQRKDSTVGRTPAPEFDSYIDGQGSEGICGNFKRTRKWNLRNGKKGLIIQKVTRTFVVESYDGTTQTWSPNAALDAYVTDPGSSVHATETQYWEAWTVSNNGTVVKNEDSFSLCSLIPDPAAASYANTTKGTFTICGEAYYYPTNSTAASLGFAADTVGAAGDLLSTTNDPGAPGAVAYGPVMFTCVSTWDSTWNGQPNTTDNPFIPPGAYSNVDAYWD